MLIESQIKPMVLLGAGASVEAGIPMVVDMTRKMIERFQSYEGPEATKTLRVLQFVEKRLRCRRKIGREEPSQGVDIENLFASVEMLARRQELEIAPFVDRWDPFIEEFESSKNILADTIEDMLRMLVEMVWLKGPEKVDYLAPLVRQGKEEVFTIATLNYDNTIELVGKVTRVPVKDGLEDWLEYGEFRKPGSGVELLKLHGSIDWHMTENVWQRRAPIPHEVIQRAPEEKLRFPDLWPALVFGAGNKLTARGPFLDLLQAFKQRLEEHDTLFIVGYSFRDEHVNEAVKKWFNKSETRKIIVIERKGASPVNNAFSRVRRRFDQRNVGARDGITDFFKSDARK